jgi:hypothetical protein
MLRDERGSISIEFAILMPLLLFMTTGGVGFWDAFYSKSRTAKVAYLIGDIMSRHDAVDATDMTYLFDLANKMLPAGLDERAVRVTSICFEDDQYRVLWSYTANDGEVIGFDPLTDTDIPLGLMPPMDPQDSVILTEVEALWEPYFVNIGLGAKVWENTLVSRPRFVKIIPHATLNPTNICPSAT